MSDQFLELVGLKKPLPPRWGGLLFVAVGAVMGKFFVYDALRAMEAGTEHLVLHATLIAMTPFVGLLGVAMLVFGERIRTMLKIDRSHLKAFQILWLVGLLLPGFVLYGWMEFKSRQYGYQDSNRPPAVVRHDDSDSEGN